MSIYSQTEVANDQHFNKSLTVEVNAVEDGATVIDGVPGKVLSIKGVFVSSDATSGRIRLYFDQDEDGSENTVGVFYADGEAGYVPVLVKGGAGQALKVDVSAVGPHYIHVNYRED